MTKLGTDGLRDFAETKGYDLVIQALDRFITKNKFKRKRSKPEKKRGKNENFNKYF